MPEQLWFTEILNHFFAGPVTGLLRALHIDPQYPQAPITNPVAMQLLVFLFLVLLFALVRSRLSVDKPSALQHIFEGAHGFVVCAFIYYHVQGIRKKGVGHYAAHFLGPSDASMSLFIRIPLSILMLPIEIVSHLARVLSLTIRLWANMFAGDLVTMAFFSMISVGVPVIFLGLHIGVSFLQTYIFILLTMVYLSGAVAEDH